MIDASLGEFLSTFTTDFNGLMTKIDRMQDNMSQLKDERVKSQGDLQRAQEQNPASPMRKTSDLSPNQSQMNPFGAIIDNPGI